VAKSFIARFLFIIIGLPIFILVVGLSIFNVGFVDFTVLPWISSLHVPLFVVILSFFAIGFLCGSAMSWLDKK